MCLGQKGGFEVLEWAPKLVVPTKTPKGMLFGGFLLHKTNQKAFLWVSWYVFFFFFSDAKGGGRSVLVDFLRSLLESAASSDGSLADMSWPLKKLSLDDEEISDSHGKSLKKRPVFHSKNTRGTGPRDIRTILH